MGRYFIFVFGLCCVVAQAALAQQTSLLGQASLAGARPLIDLGQGSAGLSGAAPIASGSLFIGQQGTSLFAPYPKRSKPARRETRPATLIQNPTQMTRLGRLRSLIAAAEAGSKGYDAVQHGAKIRPAKAPTQMTIGEIYAWIAATPGQPHAIGRYQFIPKTLARLVTDLGVPETARFSTQVQDQLADMLLAEAGLAAFSRGDMTRTAFMNNLAKIWAGLPTSSGKSHYDGYAGNKATMSWAYFDREMERIFPG